MKRTLIFGDKMQDPEIRMLSDLKEVLMERTILQEGDRELYYMYRDLAMSQKDREILSEHRLRYDITVMPPNTLGREYVKTLGHYHPPVPETDLSYPEVYEVLKGEPHYLLQKQEGVNVTDVVLIRACTGDKVIIPPNYGHVTINASNKELKMANWVSTDFSSLYEPYIERCGAAYYMTKNGLFVNPHYGNVPEVREIQPKSLGDIGLEGGKEMYGLVHTIEQLDFLNRPQDFTWIFEDVFS